MSMKDKLYIHSPYEVAKELIEEPYKFLYGEIGNKHFYDKVITMLTDKVGKHLFMPTNKTVKSSELSTLTLSLGEQNLVFIEYRCAACGTKAILTPLGLVAYASLDMVRYSKNDIRRNAPLQRLLKLQNCFRVKYNSKNKKLVFSDRLLGQTLTKMQMLTIINKVKPLFLTADNKIITISDERILRTTTTNDFTFKMNIVAMLNSNIML